MDDIIAIRVHSSDKQVHFLLTWGRVFDKIDTSELLSAVTPHLKSFGIIPESVFICDSLQEAAQSLYFYESFFKITQEKIPFGSEYKKWIRKKHKMILKGKDIFYAGVAKIQA